MESFKDVLENYDDLFTIYVKGEPICMLFTNGRVDRATVPSEAFAYDIRHGNSGNPCAIEDHVGVNHLGTLIGTKAIPMKKTPNDAYFKLTRNNWTFGIGDENDEPVFDEMLHKLQSLASAPA